MNLFVADRFLTNSMTKMICIIRPTYPPCYALFLNYLEYYLGFTSRTNTLLPLRWILLQSFTIYSNDTCHMTSLYHDTSDVNLN